MGTKMTPRKSVYFKSEQLSNNPVSLMYMFIRENRTSEVKNKIILTVLLITTTLQFTEIFKNNPAQYADIKDETGDTMLIVAVKNGNIGIASQIISRNPDVNAQNVKLNNIYSRITKHCLERRKHRFTRCIAIRPQ